MKVSPPAEEPIGLLIGALRSGISQFLASRIGSLGLSVQQFWVLVGVAERRCHSQAELAAKLRLDEASASRIVRALADRGLVRPERDEVDRRRVHLRLTEEGERLVPALMPFARQVRGTVESALTPQERTATRAGLVKIITAFQRLAEKVPLPSPAPGSRRRRPLGLADSGEPSRARVAPRAPSSRNTRST